MRLQCISPTRLICHLCHMYAGDSVNFMLKPEECKSDIEEILRVRALPPFISAPASALASPRPVGLWR